MAVPAAAPPERQFSVDACPLPAALVGDATCFHCGEPVPPDFRLPIVIDGEPRPMCCQGCGAAAQLIVDAGLTDYYRFRERPSPRFEDMPEAVRAQLQAIDHPRLREQYTRRGADGAVEMTLILEKISCPACLWLIERILLQQRGVRAASVNYGTQRARVVLDEDASLAAVIDAVQRIGYDARPFQPTALREAAERERARLLRRLGVALVFGMQVMMVTAAFYFDSGYIAPTHRRLLDVLNLALTAPVVFYAGAGFLQAAWRGLRQGVFNMDLSVSLGILLAYAGSAVTAWRGEGTTYFDSVVMFVTLLLSARYLEFMARRRAMDGVERLLRQQPMLANRLAGELGESIESVATVDLQPGDRLLVRPGEVVPADGVVIAGESSTDESLLTGEAVAVPKGTGSPIIGGSINIESPLQIRVEKVGAGTLLAGIVGAIEHAQRERPAVTALADRASTWFVFCVVLVAAATAIIGQVTGVAWFERVLAVLVITCPCALSLATPAALTFAINALMRRGVLITRGNSLETLARISHVVFDKTGTLTTGQLRLDRIETLSRIDQAACLRVAAALEHHSEHPIARAIVRAAGTIIGTASDVRSTPAAGIEGSLDGQRWYLGTSAFVEARCGIAPDAGAAPSVGQSVVFLANDRQVVARLMLNDELRPGAAAVVAALRSHGIETWLLSGDHPAAVGAVAGTLAVDHWRGGLHPDQKLSQVRELQAAGAMVMMVGDGINDAPVLAGAQVSVAMGSGADLAQLQADVVLLRNDLPQVVALLDQARRTRSVIRSNLGWAFLYNLIGLPAALLGWVTPLVAAIGMSSSSLLVLANAGRLRRITGQSEAATWK
jgi:Cu2+-exporting ATPase